jgi:hypothetical protein
MWEGNAANRRGSSSRQLLRISNHVFFFFNTHIQTGSGISRCVYGIRTHAGKGGTRRKNTAEKQKKTAPARNEAGDRGPFRNKGSASKLQWSGPRPGGLALNPRGSRGTEVRRGLWALFRNTALELNELLLEF